MDRNELAKLLSSCDTNGLAIISINKPDEYSNTPLYLDIKLNSKYVRDYINGENSFEFNKKTFYGIKVYDFFRMSLKKARYRL
jgi:hypothetical protein